MYESKDIKQEYLKDTARVNHPNVPTTWAGGLSYPTFAEKAEASGESFGDFFRKSFDIIDGISGKNS